jgi:hypothetical protein
MRFLSSVCNSEFAANIIIMFVLNAFSMGMCFPALAQPHPALPGAMPGTAPTNVVQTRTEIKDLLLTQPHEVFARLNTIPGWVIASVERMELARQAVARLANRIEVSNNPWVTLTEIRTAYQTAGPINPAIREDLGVLVCLAERRALEDAVFEIRHLAERGRWDEVVRRGQEWLKRLRGLDPVGLNRQPEGLDRQALKTRGEVQEALAGILRIGLEREALDALSEGLRTGNLEKVSAVNLPPRLSDPVRGWRGIQVVRQLAAESRLDAREIAVLKENLDLFTKCSRTLPDGDATLGTWILQDLAVRHFLQGHTAEYRALMPVDGSADRAAELLGDLKALALGKGEVGTTPARQALSAEPGKAVKPPPGMQALVSEGARKSWRAPGRGQSKMKPTALDKGIVAAGVLRTVIETDLKKERITQTEKANEAQRHIETAQRHLRQQEEADGKRFTEVETALGRPLETMEKVRVRHLAARNQTSRRIVETLKEQANPKAPRH